MYGVVSKESRKECLKVAVEVVAVVEDQAPHTHLHLHLEAPVAPVAPGAMDIAQSMVLPHLMDSRDITVEPIHIFITTVLEQLVILRIMNA
eukprot:CAMPEP_0116887562 /NCGR_PEP_ID=MMETSP0463-20121206/22120_1 /TAXON_ID=181622 /ORGANISM="Strombidinopsis sp, Strain SopsisLIS2011" /LENGTH=90 /DNA_ID=CAMNT_0004550523 /DNA_START=150 /DNA_END=422 /DNA_ORIENTATION=+